ncbi:MAG: zinc ribbon domain-containing protein [Bacteroidota bacterium]|nr:zinc ribbon domain-containing protein [Bacteroidota bacterium]MDX5428946.1 zinc ribbon domain-containing protein [Bacteroidota bacterium]MDX5447715.1 zinc ribbon domain-containing protein [Bacteroidota bacterium]MDX5506626.1 zinc ribbon domain-containing protein [Bacteroidota bacterium]
MFFIFGFGHPIHKEIGPTSERTCPRCGNTRFWILHKISHWFTLFFIPIIPTSTKRFEACPICGESQPLSQEEYQELKPIAERNLEIIESEGE